MADAPCLFPTLRYRDAEAALRWLITVVGFSERMVMRSDGAITHAELSLGSSILMIGSVREDEYQALAGDPAGRRTDALYVSSADIDALYGRVVASGVPIEREVSDTDYGSREFLCRDGEGNLWSFGTYWPKADERP